MPHCPAIHQDQYQYQFSLDAKRSKGRRDDDLNNWYEDVDDNATPGGVFWEEMERQRLFNQLGGDPSREIPISATSSSVTETTTGSGLVSGTTGTGTGTTMRIPDPMATRKPPTMEQLKSAEATLSGYTLFQVKDNWLDEDLQAYFLQLDSLAKEEKQLTLEEETLRLEQQLEALPDGIGPNSGLRDVDSEEPWDHWGEDDTNVDVDRANTLEVPPPSPGMCQIQQCPIHESRHHGFLYDDSLTL